MRHYVLLWLLPLALLAGAARAQGPVSVELLLERDQFVPDEEIVVGVRIVNRSGRTLHFGKDPQWISFTVESRDNFPVASTGDSVSNGEFVVESATAVTRRVELTAAYRFSRPGAYRVLGKVKIEEGEWREDLVTPPKNFHVFNATRVFEQDVGLPPKPGEPAGAPQMRKFVLQQARFLNNTMQLYLRLTDPGESTVFAVQPITPTLNLNAPEVQVDKESRLHVLNQIGRASFAYHVIDPEGRIVVRQIHEYSAQSRPRLRFAPDGGVVVAGGQRRMAATDVPPALEAPKFPIEVKRPGQ